MFRDYYDNIDQSNVSNEDKQTLKNFLDLLDNYKYEPDKLVGLTHDTLSDIVNSTENLGIFEDVLENKFGEYIHGIDKKTLVELLNGSRYPSRSNG